MRKNRQRVGHILKEDLTHVFKVQCGEEYVFQLVEMCCDVIVHSTQMGANVILWNIFFA